MAETDRWIDPATGRWESREVKSAADVAKGSTQGGDEGGSLKPKKTGRGMLPGESLAERNARVKKMDEERENAIQEKALTK